MPVGASTARVSQLLVLEPDGDGRERGVVPGLPVGEALVELADEIGGLLGHDARRRRRSSSGQQRRPRAAGMAAAR